MEFDFLNEIFQGHLRLDDELENALRARSRVMNFEKGIHVLLPGEVCKYIYFINSGFFRSYNVQDGEERTTGFSGQHQLITSLESFLTQSKGEEGIVCENAALALRISYYDWMAMEDLFIEFLLMSNRLLKEYLIKYKRERNLFRMASTKEKYEFLCEQYPGIINLISQKHIASYLGISAPTMSGILKDLLYKPKKNN